MGGPYRRAAGVLTCSFEEAGRLSRARREALANWQGSFARDRFFAGSRSPVLNRYTRIAVEMCPARGTLRAVGYERRAGADVAEPATEVREFNAKMLV